MMKALKILGRIVALAASFAHTTTCSAEGAPTVAIQQVLDEQAAAWNAGDIPTFMRAYKDSPDTTFMGKSVEHGYAPILERYKKAYASKDAMGTLDFSEIAVRELGANYAVVTGKFHLARNAAGGGMEDHLGSFQRDDAVSQTSHAARLSSARAASR
jgi:hypothetical protein